jgi:hypothetical protein
VSKRDLELMEYADGETGAELTAQDQQKVDALHELGELVRGRLELAADDVPDARFDAMWREIDKQLAPASPVAAPAPDAVSRPGLLTRLGRSLERYRSQILTGAISAGAVAALALILRGGAVDPGTRGERHAPLEVQTVAHRRAEPAVIEALDTPDGTSSVFNVDDEDGTTTVIWVTPEDTVEGI